MEIAMPDPYSIITQLDQQSVDAIADVLELRAADPQQTQMREKYLSWLELAPGAKVLEAGCGTGAVGRHVSQLMPSSSVVGLDPSPQFVTKARDFAADQKNIEFVEGDARSMPFEDSSFDAVVFHTCLCHVPTPEKAIAEAHRVLRPRGKLAIFDGDYSTTTLAIGPHDPLQRCAEAMMNEFVHDLWLTRRLPPMLRGQGFAIDRIDSHGYVQNEEPNYSLSLVDRGADTLAATGQIDADTAVALKNAARRRAADGNFYGFINFISLIATRS
jgi:ubiquinone/menaquinone biosynthesis C-methylase UbiE